MSKTYLVAFVLSEGGNLMLVVVVAAVGNNNNNKNRNKFYFKNLTTSIKKFGKKFRQGL
jgi:hypothetical protein